MDREAIDLHLARCAWVTANLRAALARARLLSAEDERTIREELHKANYETQQADLWQAEISRLEAKHAAR